MLAQAVSVTISTNGYSYCGQATASLQAGISGGVPPYTIAWSNGVTTEYNMGLTPGTYTVIVTDAVLDADTATEVVASLPGYTYTTFNEEGGYCWPEIPYVSFYGGTENGMPCDPALTGCQHGPGPYTFDAVGYTDNAIEFPDACNWFSYYVVSINAPPGAVVTVNYADGAGCPGSFQTTIKPPMVFPPMQLLSVTGSCTNGAMGSATISVGAVPNGQSLQLFLRDSNGTYVDECSSNWVHNQPITHTYEDLAPGDYWAVLDFDLFNQFANGTNCTDSLLITVPDLGTLCGQVNGRIYVDGNANCAYNGGENLVPTTVIEITPGPYYAITNANGAYSVTLPYGTYSFAEQHTVLVQSCPTQATVASGIPLQNVNLGCLGGAPLDVQLIMSNGAARPGFELFYALAIDNLTSSPTGTVTLTMDFDPALGFVSATPAPSSVAGNTITWTAPFFTMTSAFQHKDVGVRLLVPPDIGLVGSTLVTTATITTANTDADLANNTYVSSQVVTASLDPNDKAVRTSTDASVGQYFIGDDEWLDYTIRFQNTGTDTAFNVVITDTLEADLDPATIQWGASSHTCIKELGAGGVVKFIFPNILLPDSNVNEPLSHGLVGFRIKPKQPLLPGTFLSNVCDIYFDFNPPVHTNTAEVEATVGMEVQEHGQDHMLLFPNPVNDVLYVTGQAAGTGMLDVEIRGTDGRSVMRARIASGTSAITVASLASGSYMVSFRSVDGSERTLRFVKW